MREPPHVPRSVKPRSNKPVAQLPLIAVTDDTILLERTGETYPYAELATVLRSEPSSLVVVENHAAVVYDLTRQCANDERWQFRATCPPRYHYKPDGTRSPLIRKDTVVSFFGWRGERKKRGHWHYPLDPQVFCKRSVTELVPQLPRLQQLMKWGCDVREWCGAQNLRVAPTGGGVAAQLLRDERFWKVPRRKVPSATNTRARTALPGNHYRLYCETGKPLNATYLDMRSAHHWCASQVQFPHADGLFARGRFHSCEELPKPYASEGAQLQHALSGHGLLLAYVHTPHLRPDMFVPPYMEKHGTHLAFIFTNELPLISSLGGRVEGVVASWTSQRTDDGLNRYARWCLSHSAGTHRKRWLKPTLLSAYGVLAAKPLPQEFGFHHGHGDEAHFPTTRGPLTVHLVKRGRVEPKVANVIWRGMIEAETRKRALLLAGELHAGGKRVLSIYADSVFVESDGVPLPLLPEPWIVKDELTRLRFYTPTVFVSNQLAKLPGIPREDALREAMLKQAWQPVASVARDRDASVRAVR